VPPVQIPASGTTAPGSYLELWRAKKRSSERGGPKNSVSDEDLAALQSWVIQRLVKQMRRVRQIADRYAKSDGGEPIGFLSKLTRESRSTNSIEWLSRNDVPNAMVFPFRS
jgi:hypothetical protein